MKAKTKDFEVIYCRYSEDIADAISESFEGSNVDSYFLFINTWDPVCKTILTKIKEKYASVGAITLYVIDTFDIPNGLNILKTETKRISENFPVSFYGTMTKLPYLVILSKNGFRYIDYSGSVFAELGL